MQSDEPAVTWTLHSRVLGSERGVGARQAEIRRKASIRFIAGAVEIVWGCHNLWRLVAVPSRVSSIDRSLAA